MPTLCSFNVAVLIAFHPLWRQLEVISVCPDDDFDHHDEERIKQIFKISCSKSSLLFASVA